MTSKILRRSCEVLSQTSSSMSSTYLMRHYQVLAPSTLKVVLSLSLSHKYPTFPVRMPAPSILQPKLFHFTSQNNSEAPERSPAPRVPYTWSKTSSVTIYMPITCILITLITLQLVNQWYISFTNSFEEGSINKMVSFLSRKGQDEEGKGRGRERPALGPTTSTP